MNNSHYKKTNTHAHVRTQTAKEVPVQHAPFDLSSLPISKLTGKPVLHFIHANGVPSACYQPLFDVWDAHFSVEYIEFFGTQADYPVDDAWASLTRQVLDSVAYVCEKHGVAKLVATGHSMGALSTLLAAYQAPTHFAQLLLMDPPMIYGKDSFAWHMAKQLERLPMMAYRIRDKMSPAGKSKHRKDRWDSKATAYDNLRHKSLFQAFDSRAFDAYITHGVIEDGAEGYRLAIPKAVEVAVFRNNPSYFWLKPNQPPAVPACILAGRDSLFMALGYYAKVAQRLKIPYALHQGTHMYPLEHPESVAMTVLEMIKQQLNTL